MEWWEDNKHQFVFDTEHPVTIDTTHNYSERPHVSTQTTGNLLILEAVHATNRQIVERAAAELGVEVFIGEQSYMDILTTVRMRGVTFEEFAYLIGRNACVRGFEYRKTGAGYHFGGKTKAKPWTIMNGWGIAMERTVFSLGEDIPIIIVTRGVGEMIDPSDPVFSSYGSFKITDNAGNVIKNYLLQAKERATVPLFQKENECTRIDLILDGGRLLKPGEYNITFKYLENETPSIAFEVYEKILKKKDDCIEQNAPADADRP